MSDMDDPFSQLRRIRSALDVVTSVVEAARRGDFDSTDKLIELTSTPDWEVLLDVVVALAEFGPRRAVSALVHEACASREACRALGDMGYVDAVPGLIGLYRYGKPRDYGDEVATIERCALVDELFERSVVDAANEDLSIVTGQQFKTSNPRELASLWWNWWKENGAKFKTGRRYFNGHEVPAD